MTLQRVQPGDPLSAEQENLLIEQVNRMSRPGAAGKAQYGTAGIAFFGPPETRLALFELTESVTYPTLSGAPSDHFDRDPTPYAKAKPVACHPHQTADKTPSGDPVRSYKITLQATEQTIWFPLNRRDASGYAIGPPLARSGTRVLCLFNRQSARWEVVQGPPYAISCWAKLDGPLAAGGYATASLWWGAVDSGVDVTAWDWLLKAGTNLPTGTKVKVDFFPQDGLWWVTAAECA